MASYLQPGYSAQNAGFVRNQTAQVAAGVKREGMDGTKGLSAMLLAAMVSALVVVADQLIDTWADGHLMVAWVALWLIGFAALAIFAGAARTLALTVMGALNDWSASVAKARADERLWVIAKSDPRVMADLTAAMARSER